MEITETIIQHEDSAESIFEEKAISDSIERNGNILKKLSDKSFDLEIASWVHLK